MTALRDDVLLGVESSPWPAGVLDPGSSTPLRPLDPSGAQAVRGRVGGVEVIAYGVDATRIGGTDGTASCEHVVHAIDTAVAEGLPVLGVWHSGGAGPVGDVEELDAVARVAAAAARASGRVPRISLVLGWAAGRPAWWPALADVVIAVPVPGDDGERVGLVDVVAEDERDACERVRGLVALLGGCGRFRPGRALPDDGLHALVPARGAYDVRPLLRRLVDDGELVEVGPDHAPNLVVGLARLTGATVGVVANNPLHDGGRLDREGAEKGARFVRMCQAFDVPLVVVVDVPGHLPGVEAGATLVQAFAETTVPSATLVTHKAFGDAYVAMNARSLGAAAVYAWPGAEVGEVDVPHLAAGRDRISDGLCRALLIGAVDEVIDPTDTRRRLAEALVRVPADPVPSADSCERITMSTAVSPVSTAIRVVRPPAVCADAKAWCGTAVVGITEDEPVFAGHYPGFPIFPGMCVVEYVHQAGLLTAPHDAGGLVLSAMESVRFLAPVFPGDELRMELEWRRDGHDWQLTGKASTGSGDVAAVRMRYRLDGAW